MAIPFRLFRASLIGGIMFLKQRRQTILQVIDELDYQPNELARHLSHGKTRQIGVVIPNTIHPFLRKY